MDNAQATSFVFGENNFRIGALFWLATCNDGMNLPDELESAVEDWVLDGLFPDYDEDLTFAEFLVEEGKFGFLARVETPTPTAAYSDGYSTHGWGMYGEQWVYAETLDELLLEAQKASKSYIERRLAKLRAA